MKKFAATIFAFIYALAVAIPATAAMQTLWGKILDSANKPITGVQVSITQGGNSISTLTTAADGAYSFNVAQGAYSMQLTPPAGYSRLFAYDISAPQSQALNFTLTPPTPGRAFLSGHVVAGKGFVLDFTNTNISFGGSSGPLKDMAGNFYLTPTAGTTSSFAISGTSGSFGLGFANKLERERITVFNLSAELH